MRRFWAPVRSAALQALAEPLSVILFLVAMATVHLIPVFHYHQFGEAGRLARECGFSALLVFGLAFVTTAAVRAVGGEIENGTAAAALARPVPRPLFFCARTFGVMAAFAVFCIGVSAAALTALLSAEAGARLAALGAPSHVWRPGLLIELGGIVLALLGAAAAHRFGRCRFCVSASLLLAGVQPVGLAGMLLIPGAAAFVSWKVVPPLAVLACACLVFTALAAALSVCLKPAVVSALVVGSVLLSFIAPIRAVLPDISRFWLVDRLAGGGQPLAGEMWAAVAAACLLTVFWLIVGSCLLSRREIP